MRPEVSILAAGLAMRRNRPVQGGTTQGQTDVKSFDWMEPMAGGFRNYQRRKFNVPAEERLVGGLRALDERVLRQPSADGHGLEGAK